MVNQKHQRKKWVGGGRPQQEEKDRPPPRQTGLDPLGSRGAQRRSGGKSEIPQGGPDAGVDSMIANRGSKKYLKQKITGKS